MMLLRFHTWLAWSFAIFLSYGMCSATWAQENKVDVILSTIERVCGKDAAKGERLEFEISGSGNIQVLKMLRFLGTGELAGETSLGKTEVEGLLDEVNRAKEIDANRQCKMKYFDDVAPKLFQLILGVTSSSKEECLQIRNEIRTIEDRQEVLLNHMDYATESQRKSFHSEYARNRESLSALGEQNKNCI